jgi:sulfate adenylyltransferase subunit 1 (EFTu-like GTPase family)
VADYTPIALPGQTFTSQASGAITGGDPVVVSGSGTVARAATLASTAYLGIAGHDAVSGQKITLTLAKAIHESVADGTVTAGDQLTTTNTANRQVKSLAASNVDVGAAFAQAAVNTAINTSVNQARAVIGTAMTTASDNTLVRWAQR